MEDATTSTADHPSVPPGSKPRRLRAGVPPSDGRSADAVLLRRTRAELVAHCGGKVSGVQRALIEQAAQLKLRLKKMDQAFAETGAQTEHSSRVYLAWANSYSRLLRQLGLQGAPSHDAPGLHRLLSGINTPATASPPSSRVTGATAP